MKLTKTPISAKKVLNEAFDYDKPATFSRWSKIQYGPFSMLIISWTASVDSLGKSVYFRNFKKQFEKTMENLSALISEAWLEWKDVIKTNIYLASMKYYEEFCQLRKDYYDNLDIPFYPASTCVQAKLCRPELLIEIELTAIKVE